MGDLKDLTDAQLAAIAERAEKALEGSWDYKAGIFKHYVYSPTNEHFGFSMQEMSYLDGSDCPWTAATAVFIAQSRSDVPALLAHITALAARLAEAEQTIVQRVATIHGLSTIIDGHEAEMEDLGQRCDKATAQLAAAQATIANLRRECAAWGVREAEERLLRTQAQATIARSAPVLAACLACDEAYQAMDLTRIEETSRTWLAAMKAYRTTPPAPEADDAR